MAEILIRGGTVVTMDPGVGDLVSGDVLVRDGRIAVVGAGIEAVGAEVVDASGMVVIPGLIDTHIHMWQQPLRGLGADLFGLPDYLETVWRYRERFSAGDMYGSTYACGVEMLGAGVTTALDFCHNTVTTEHVDEALRGHLETGQRVLFAYGMIGSLDAPAKDHGARLEQVAKIQDGLGDGLVRVGVAPGSLEYGGIEQAREDIEFARDRGLRMTLHQNPPGQIAALRDAGLLGGDILPVHANVATDEELGMLAAVGCGIAFTVEGEFGGGRSMSVLCRAERAGVMPTLGVDVPSEIAVDMLAQLRITYRVVRAMEAQEERDAGRLPLKRRPGVPFSTPRRVLEYATVNAARVLGMETEIGSITPGKQADIVLLRTGPFGVALGDPAAHVVLQSNAGDVDTVLVAGVFRKRAGELVGVDPERAARLSQETRDRVLAG